MDRELAGTYLSLWEKGLPIGETTLFKAASALGVDPERALVEARFYTYFDSYLMEKRAMSRMERIVFSACAGIDPFAMQKTASAYGFSPDELIVEALRERGFVPDLDKLANLAQPMVGGQQTVDGQGPPDMSDPNQMQAMQDALGIMGAPPQQDAAVQQQPQARGFKPSPMAPEQLPPSSQGNMSDLLQNQQDVYGQGAMDNGGLPPSNMPEPPPDPPSPEERIQQVGPSLDPETIGRYSEQLTRFEQGINMQISDPKQMVKFVKELQKVDGKRIDQGIKAMGQQLEQEQASELGVSGVPTIDGQVPTTSVLAPKSGDQEQSPDGNPMGQQASQDGGQQAAQSPQAQQAQQAQKSPGMQQAKPQQRPQPQKAPPGQDPSMAAAEKVAHAARLLARTLLR
jgi:hypothetical protein